MVKLPRQVHALYLLRKFGPHHGASFEGDLVTDDLRPTSKYATTPVDLAVPCQDERLNEQMDIVL